MIGFKNSFYELKDKNGIVKLDNDGNPKLRDMRSDFSQAIRCLRNTAGFVEGSSLHDTEAHFVIQKSAKLSCFRILKYKTVVTINSRSVFACVLWSTSSSWQTLATAS